MTLRKVSFVQGTVAAPYKLPAEDHRLNHAGLWVPRSAADGLRVRSGIVWGPGATGAVTVTAGGVNVAPFHAVIQGTVNGIQGPYEVTSDAAEFRAITAASPTEFRRGYLIARIRDQLASGGVVDDWTIEPYYGPNAATAGAAQLPNLAAIPNVLSLREFAVSNTGVVTLAGPPAARTGPRFGVLPVEDTDTTAPPHDGAARWTPAKGLELGVGGVWGPPNPAMARAMLYATATSAVAGATTWFTLNLAGEMIDTHGGREGAAGSYTVPAGQGGLWELEGAVHYVGLASPAVFATRVAVNGVVPANIGHGAYVQAIYGGSGMMPTGRKLVTLAAGDVVALQGFGGSIWQGGANLALGQTSQLSLVRIS